MMSFDSLIENLMAWKSLKLGNRESSHSDVDPQIRREVKALKYANIDEFPLRQTTFTYQNWIKALEIN